MTLVLNKFIDHLKTEAAKADCDKWDVDDYLDKDLEYSVTAPIVTDVNTDTLKQWLRDFTVENNTIDADIEELMELLRCFGYIKKIDKTTYKITLEMYESMQEAVLDLKGRPSRCSGLWKHVQIM
jgi:hypothetical protein